MNNLNPIFNFNYHNNPIRVLTINNEVWFVASDILDSLGLDRKALERLDDDEKGVASIHTPGGIQDMIIINYPGLYNLVLSSRKPEAKPFKRWVTHDVLPQIQQNGFYGTAAYTVRPHGDFHPEALLNPEERKQLLALRPDWNEIYDFMMRGMNANEVADKLGKAKTTVYNKVSRMRRCGILPHPRRTAAELERKLIALTKQENGEVH